MKHIKNINKNDVINFIVNEAIEEVVKTYFIQLYHDVII